MLKTIPLLLAALLVPAALLADEVELKLSHDLSKDTPFYVKGRLMSFRNHPGAPEGAVAPEHTTALLLGSGAALICGVVSLWAFVRTLRARVFHRFAYYTWAVGLLVLLLARG